MEFLIKYEERIQICDNIIRFHSEEEQKCIKTNQVEWRNYHLMKIEETKRYKKILEDQKNSKSDILLVN